MTIAFVKFVHIAAILCWAGGLIALPALLARHHPDENQEEYARARKLTHYSYTRFVTPAAVIAVAAGTILIFLRDLFVPWMFAKLVAVGALVVVHALVGNVVVRMGELGGARTVPSPTLLIIPASAVILAILVLVLAKPPISEALLPEWLQAPLHRQLPLEEVPI